MRYISTSWLNGETPKRAEDIKLAPNHNFHATVETIKDIFRGHKAVYLKYAEANHIYKEKFDHDLESLSMDIVKAQNSGKMLKVQKLKLFDQFESHKLEDFKQSIFTLLEDLLKSSYPTPTALQVNQVSAIFYSEIFNVFDLFNYSLCFFARLVSQVRRRRPRSLLLLLRLQLLRRL